MPDDNNIGAFLLGIEESKPKAPPIQNNLEVLMALGHQGRLNHLEVDDLIKKHGFRPEHFSELPGGWFRLNSPQGAPNAN